jgi:probable HAF family extracellular repeat protein
MKKSIQQQRHLEITTRRALAGTTLGLLWLLSAPGLASAQYAITQLDVPGSSATYADGNSVHRVVGEFDDEDGTHGFVMNGGEFTPFDVPGAQGYTSINGINASGERAGIYFSGERYYGYFWSHGVVTPLDPPGSTFSLAGFLNAKGQVVGFYRTGPNGTGTRRGYIWHDGVFTPVDVPGAGPRGTWPSGINNQGQVVGAYWDQDGQRHGFLLSKGTYTTLDVPGSEGGGITFAQGINNAGLIVGFYATADGLDQGFVLSKKGYTTINVPGATWTDIYSVNPMGDIVGAFEDSDGNVHGFRGTPAGRLLPDPPAE